MLNLPRGKELVVSFDTSELERFLSDDNHEFSVTNTAVWVFLV